jgi:outer membrane immunogenic protein
MKRLLLASAASLMLFVGGNADAADLPPVRSVPPPVVVPPPAYSWTGCYLGGGGGYGMYNQEVYSLTDPGRVQNSETVTMGGRGWFATVQVGCDLQIGSSVVVGAFGDYDFSINMKGNLTIPLVTSVGEEKLRSSWAAGGRIGWLPVPQLLTFFSGGFTQARFGQVDFRTLQVPAVPVDQHIAATTYNGWFIGSGYEYAVGWVPGIFWKTEYRFADYSPETVSVTTAAGGLIGTAINSHKYVHTVRSELVWRFSFGGPLFARY